MAGRNLLEDAAGELTVKAVMWGPAIAGAALLGPVGAVLGLAASVAIATKVSSSSQPGGDQGARGRNVPSK
jgi:hypothetical protein